MNSPKPLYINYPVSLCVFKSNKRIIFLFGDAHTTRTSKLCSNCNNNNECMTFDFWLREFIEKSNVMVDVFIEDAVSHAVQQEEWNQEMIDMHRLHKKYNEKIDPLAKGSLHNVRQNFQHCFYNQCHKNARFHAIDIRLDKFMVPIFYQKLHGVLQKKIKVEDAREFYRAFIIFIIEEQPTDLGTNVKKLLKQLNSLKTSNIKVYNEIVDMLIETIPDGLHTQKEWDLFRNEYGLDGTAIILSNLMDAYFLARMFKTTLSTKIIVVYAGFAHISNYINFFENVLNYKILLKVGSYDLKKCNQLKCKQCVKIDEKSWSVIENEIKNL